MAMSAPAAPTSRQVDSTATAYRNTATAFWHEHLFDPGPDGEVEVLWVTYRDAGQAIDRLEVHHLTQQAVVPLIGEIIQVVALSDEEGAPDLATIRAFHLSTGVGICMHPSVWHATRTIGPEATCLMLTRRSTTLILSVTLPMLTRRGRPVSETYNTYT
jgi:ureidoglycolate lyase